MSKRKIDHPCYNCGFGYRCIEDIRNNDHSNYFCTLGKKHECDKKKQYDRKRNNEESGK